MPHFFDGEPQSIVDMLDNGVERVHIRKPGAPTVEIRHLLEQIPEQYLCCITLHDGFELAADFAVGGLHINSRNCKIPAGFHGLISCSCHSLAELDGNYDYAFLSPVFNSISKVGYDSRFSPAELKEACANGIINEKVFALGGVTPQKFNEIESLGFGGAAMLGAAWNPVNLDNFRLQYITCGATPEQVFAEVLKVLRGGCRWVQLRMKEAPSEIIMRTGIVLAQMCRNFGATFIVDDHVELVEAIGAHGVHIGKNDMPVSDAVKILGPGFIVGATANTGADIRAAALAGASYCGLGPLRFTTTKKNLSTILGYDGVEKAIAEAAVDIPVVAIGGITTADIEPLAAAGTAGVAVCGNIAAAENPMQATSKYIELINKYII